MFWYLFEGITVLMLIIFLATQIVLPPFFNLPFFWIFRRKAADYVDAEAELMDAKTGVEVRKLEKLAKKLNRRKV